MRITPKPAKPLSYNTLPESGKLVEDRGGIRSVAQNWSGDVFLSLLNDYPEKDDFLIFPKYFTPIFDFLMKIHKKK